jgi:hypothetical protein
MLSIGGEWNHCKEDLSGNTYYVSESRKSSLITESKSGATHIRFILRSNLKEVTMPVLIRADDVAHLATVKVTHHWKTYVVPLPFAKGNVKISFEIGEDTEQFSTYVQAGGKDGLQIALYSLETFHMVPSTFEQAHFQLWLPRENKLDVMEKRLMKAEDKISEISRLFPIRLYRRLRGLK